MKRIYLFDADDYYIGIVARSYGQAKMTWLKSDYGQGELYLEINPLIISKVSAKGLPYGILDPLEGLKRGVWTRVIDTKCPICKHESDLYYRNEKIGCAECLGITGDEKYD